MALGANDAREASAHAQRLPEYGTARSHSPCPELIVGELEHDLEVLQELKAVRVSNIIVPDDPSETTDTPFCENRDSARAPHNQSASRARAHHAARLTRVAEKRHPVMVSICLSESSPGRPRKNVATAAAFQTLRVARESHG